MTYQELKGLKWREKVEYTGTTRKSDFVLGLWIDGDWKIIKGEAYEQLDERLTEFFSESESSDV